MPNLSASPVNWISGVAAKERLTGTSGNDQISGNGGADTLAGGFGDDTYIVYDAYDVVSENAGEGIDTVITYGGGHKLAANVENLTLRGANNSFATGNSLANRLIGNTGNNAISGGGGDDLLTGGGGSDTFAFARAAGHSVITDFQTGTGAGADIVRLADLGIVSFAQFQSRLTQVGADTVLALAPDQTVTFTNTSKGAFAAANADIQASPSSMRLSFADEFNSASLDTAASTGTWKTTFYNGGRTLGGNQELQRYVDAAYAGYGNAARAPGVDPFSVKDGVLTISAKPVDAALTASVGGSAYTSGLLTTEHSFTQTYGYFEVRAQLPEGKGLWPAFWLLPADYAWPPEIDVFELGGSDPTDLHFGVVTQQNAANFNGAVHAPGLTTGMHTYALDWRPDRLTWYLDGVAIGSTATPASMQRPMYMLLNLAVGGTFDGNPDATTKFPAGLQIDYVHAYSYDAAGPLAPLVTFGNAVDTNDMSDSYTATLPAVGGTQVYTAKQLDIAGLDAGARTSIVHTAIDAVTINCDTDWNTVKDVLVRSTARADVTVNNFVAAEITLGGDAATAGSVVTVHDAKRGEVYLGNGDDAVAWRVGGDGGGTIRIGTQGGNDWIAIDGRVAAKVIVDAGAGDDVLRLSGALTGTITTGSGADKVIVGHGVALTITDFELGADSLQFDGLGAAGVQLSWIGNDTVLQVGGDVRVTLAGLHVGLPEIALLLT